MRQHTTTQLIVRDTSPAAWPVQGPQETLPRMLAYCDTRDGRWHVDCDGEQIATHWYRPTGWREVKRRLEAAFPECDVLVDILSREDLNGGR